MNNEEVTACGAATVGGLLERKLLELPDCSISMEYEGGEGRVNRTIRVIGMSESGGEVWLVAVRSRGW